MNQSTVNKAAGIALALLFVASGFVDAAPVLAIVIAAPAAALAGLIVYRHVR